MGKSVAELDNLTLKSNALEETCSSQREQIRILQHQLAAATEKLKMSDLSALETRAEFEEKKRVMSELQDRLADAELQLIEGEKLRKKLHNTILELKGNIRVFCRVRSLLPDDGARTEMPVVSYPVSMESQDHYFGSGKTYTMMGMPEALEKKGLIPRSLEQIFQTSQLLQAQGWKYKMQASMLEIYNETICDLLSVNRSSGLDLVRSENRGVGKQYAIKHDANGNTHVSDLTIVDASP